MKLGDTLTIAGTQWTIRPFTAAEHQAFDALAESHQLARKAAEAQAAVSTRGGTARETLLKGDVKRLQAKLGAYLDGDALRDGLTEQGRLDAYEVAAQIDDLTVKINELQEERAVEALLREEELLQARENVTIDFMHAILKPTLSVAEFAAALTPDEIVQLDEVVALGKLRTGLSASNRRQAAYWDRQVALIQSTQGLQSASGNASASQPQQLDAPQKPGKVGRSRKSSSKSKAGA